MPKTFAPLFVFGWIVVSIIALAVFPAQAATIRKESIAVVVNKDAVTESDIADRVKLIMASSGLPDRPEVREKVRAQITSMLIDERIKTQEAKRLKLSVDDKDIDDAIQTIAQQNNMSADNFKKMLSARGIKIPSLRDQIRAQLLWSRVVARQIRPNVTITDRDIDTEYNRLQTMVGETEYALSEILLPAAHTKDEQNSRDLAPKIMAEVREHPQAFPAIARQFSKAPGAQTGGMIGWVANDQLDSDLQRALKSAKKGDVVGPIKTYQGLHILYVHDVRTRTEKDLPSRDDIQKRLFMERLDRLQESYFLDLKSSAFIQPK